MNKIGFFPYTPATQMLQGLAVSIDMLHEEGSTRLCAPRAARGGDAACGARLGSRNPVPRSEILFADRHGGAAPDCHDADAFRSLALDAFQHIFWGELRTVRKKVLPHRPSRDVNDGWQIGALAATEMGVSLAGIPHKKGGVSGRWITSCRPTPARARAAE